MELMNFIKSVFFFLRRKKVQKLSDDIQERSFCQLPDEILEKIFCRLPVQSLLGLRCISKSCLTLISSPYFVKLHLKQTVNSKINLNLYMSCINRASNFYRVDFDSLEKDDGYLQPVEVNYNPLSHLNYRTSIWGSCDGLTGLPIERHDNITGLGRYNDGLVFMTYTLDIVVLWNPSSRKSIKLPPTSVEIPNHSYRHKYSTYGIGYDKISDDYKVVRIVVVLGEPIYYEDKVYSLRTNLWHKANKHSDHHPDLETSINAIAGGAMHWMSVGMDDKLSILAFHLGTETYRSLLGLRCISKSCLTLISSPYFVKLHLKQSVQSKINLNLYMSCINRALNFYRVDFDSLEKDDE
ncbi:F-box protein CPR1-like [Impatiens glandulifera]|uniref:F-box protein CPR1-like n=1 Tax=Impatiens glandulifera TaxID=253017 RepID=UPI001FB08739|nr:F-box protein CPR1-like [Impatiens glandulifera]